ncbi:MAG TPA: antibiotic biosynthesis monooxygenase [Methylomirabilota bacterium]|nr:antibiotic biosynthesis monooxygenase [Methylomirabilota bacterium]
MYPIGLLQSLGRPAFPNEVFLDCRVARAEDGTTIFVVLWEYEVKPGCEESFQSAYSSHADWVRIFQRDPHFRESRLLRDLSRPRFYFTLDYWDSESSYHKFVAANLEAYGAVDRSTEGLTLSERHLSSFDREILSS